MDTAHWPQIKVKHTEEKATNKCPKTRAMERKPRPQKDQALNCPRCNSTNTKFCYYNNYSLTQPRYFCKTCRRYWTEGGSLRNIPAGGGSRKNKRSSTYSSASKKVSEDRSTTQNPKIPDGQDLNLAFPSTQDIRSFSELIQVPSTQNYPPNHNQNQVSSSSTSITSPSQISALELFTGVSLRGLNTFLPMPVHKDPKIAYTAGFPLQDFKPTLNFSLDGLEVGYENLQEIQETSNTRVLFPFEGVRLEVSSTGDHVEQNKENGDSTGCWTGMLGGGSW